MTIADLFAESVPRGRTFSAAEQRAYDLGVARYDAARQQGRPKGKDFHGGAVRARRNDGYSALAEWTVATCLDRDWVGGRILGRRDDGVDVADNIDVKWTEYEAGHLVIQPDNRTDLVYVLVVGLDLPLRVVGWSFWPEATKDTYWRDDLDPPAWFAPQAALCKDWWTFDEVVPLLSGSRYTP